MQFRCVLCCDAQAFFKGSRWDRQPFLLLLLEGGQAEWTRKQEEWAPKQEEMAQKARGTSPESKRNGPQKLAGTTPWAIPTYSVEGSWTIGEPSAHSLRTLGPLSERNGTPFSRGMGSKSKRNGPKSKKNVPQKQEEWALKARETSPQRPRAP